jgi:uncharacterized membrane protein
LGASSQPEPGTAARRIYRAEWKQLSAHERQVIEGVLHRISLPRDLNKELRDRRTLGERAADLIATFGGSWTFILLFGGWLVCWIVLNTEILASRHAAFDPYPYEFGYGMSDVWV